MEPDRYNYIYRRYLNNTCLPEEIDELYRLIRKNKFTEDNLFSIEATIQSFPTEQLKLDPKVSNDIFQRIITQNRLVKRRANVKLFLKYISAAAILLVISVVAYNIIPNRARNTNIFTNHSIDIKRIDLQDGSYAILKPGTRIHQITDFEQDSIRLITLEGEAFFSIAKRADQPFLIHSTDNFTVRVLGTRFNLNFQKDNREVILTEGKLSIANEQDKVVLFPSQKARYSEETNTFQTSAVDTLIYTSWVDGLLYFKDTPLKEVIHQLHINYETNDLQLHQKFDKLQFTGYLPINDLNRCKEILKKTFANQNLTFL